MPAGELHDVFGGVEADVPDALADHLRGIALIDHHVHGNFNQRVGRADFEAAINEGSTDPVPDFMSQFDSPLGLSIRRWCAPLLGLDALASADDYWARRSEFTPDEAGQADAACRGRLALDRRHRFQGRPHHHPEAADRPEWHGRPRRSFGSSALAEDLLEDGTSPEDFPGAFRSALKAAAESTAVVGTKTIAAYRTGFDIDWSQPSDADVIAHARALRGAATDRCGSTARC